MQSSNLHLFYFLRCWQTSSANHLTTSAEWWCNTKEIPLDQHCRSGISGKVRGFRACRQSDKSELQSSCLAGPFISMPLTHPLNLNLRSWKEDSLVNAQRFIPELLSRSLNLNFLLVNINVYFCFLMEEALFSCNIFFKTSKKLVLDKMSLFVCVCVCACVHARARACVEFHKINNFK